MMKRLALFLCVSAFCLPAAGLPAVVQGHGSCVMSPNESLVDVERCALVRARLNAAERVQLIESDKVISSGVAHDSVRVLAASIVKVLASSSKVETIDGRPVVSVSITAELDESVLRNRSEGLVASQEFRARVARLARLSSVVYPNAQELSDFNALVDAERELSLRADDLARHRLSVSDNERAMAGDVIAHLLRSMPVSLEALSSTLDTVSYRISWSLTPDVIERIRSEATRVGFVATKVGENLVITSALHPIAWKSQPILVPHLDPIPFGVNSGRYVIRLSGSAIREAPRSATAQIMGVASK